MDGDQSTGALKTFVKAVGLTLLIAALGTLILNAHDTKPIGYFFFGVIAFFAWRMFRVWDKSTVQVYALVQSILTGIAAGQVANIYLPHAAHLLGILVVLWFGSNFERFLVRYTGFSSQRPTEGKEPRPPSDVDGTPWQITPAT